jgi:hypothetical protein
MSKIKRTTVTLPAGLYERAESAMKAQDFTTFSDYVQHLIREDARQHGAYTAHGLRDAYNVAPSSASPVPPTTQEVAEALGRHAAAEVSARKHAVVAPTGRIAARVRAALSNPSPLPTPPKQAPK